MMGRVAMFSRVATRYFKRLNSTAKKGFYYVKDHTERQN